MGSSSFFFFSPLTQTPFLCADMLTLLSQDCVLYGYAPVLPVGETQMYSGGRKAATPRQAWN